MRLFFFVVLFCISLTTIAQDGYLDSTFGINGKSSIYIPNATSKIYDLAIQSDGKIVGVGSVENILFGLSDILLVRFNEDGSLDESFGTDGVVLTDLGGIEKAFTVGIQNDGKIVVAGTNVVRYMDNGDIDTSFGANAISDYQCNTIIFIPGQKILIGHLDGAFRLNENGSLDITFGTNGFIDMDLVVNSIANYTDGQILAVGYWNNGFNLAMFHPSGLPDTTFGSMGYVYDNDPSFFGTATKVLVNQIGKIFVGGFGGTLSTVGEGNNFCIQTFDGGGNLDLSYGDNGIISTDLGNNLSDKLYDMEFAEDGTIIAVGSTIDEFSIVKYKENGQLDPSFANNGVQKTSFGIGTSNSYSVKIQTDGKVVVGGFHNQNIAVSRYNNTLFTSINNYDSQGEYFIYPNPTFSELTVKVDGLQDAHIKLYDSLGQLLEQSQCTKDGITLRMDRPSGMYFVKVQQGTASRTFPVVKL